MAAVAGGVDAAAVQAAADHLHAQATGRRIMVIGEMHGTREAPAVVAALAMRDAARMPVLVALEIPRSEHRALSAYMESDGGDHARQRLRSGAFWQVAPADNDGRRTEEVLDLVEALRRLRSTGHDVAVTAFDITPDLWRDAASRDRDMARLLRAAHAAMPRGRLLVLAGNVHARRVPPAMLDDGSYRTATQWLADLAPLSVNLTAASGAFWGCGDTVCGPIEVTLPAAADTPGYDITYVLPAWTPARLVGEAR